MQIIRLWRSDEVFIDLKDILDCNKLTLKINISLCKIVIIYSYLNKLGNLSYYSNILNFIKNKN